MPLANKNWQYNFREISSKFTAQKNNKVINALWKRFAKIECSWCDDDNSEWICRNYFAAKLIMSATLNINAMNYSKQRNLRMITPYLKYYALLSLMRALILTIPEKKWEGGDLLQISHKQAITLTIDYIGLFDKEYAREVDMLARSLKSSRELISYYAPTSGDINLYESDNYIEVCRILCEFAQLNSEILENSIRKKRANERFMFNYHDMLAVTYKVFDDNNYHDDEEDAYRLSRFIHKHHFPVSLQRMMSEGHVEDFFGAWCNKNELDEENINFNPDLNTNIIFDIP
jgi:hypothetical protein